MAHRWDAWFLFDNRHCMSNDDVAAVPLQRVQSHYRHQLGCPPFTRASPSAGRPIRRVLTVTR